jgi:hypothetical protein
MRPYAAKTEDELAFIVKDAGEAARCANELGNSKAEGKYRDQVCDAVSEQFKRRQSQLHRKGRATGAVKQLLAA